jgi:hypothetical protein
VKIDWRDLLATLLVAAIVAPYIGYLARGSMPFIEDPRGMAATALALGVAAVVVVGRRAFRGTWGVAAGFFAVASAGLGVVAFVRSDEGALSEGLLAVLVGAIVVAWLLAELVRTRLVPPRRRRPVH